MKIVEKRLAFQLHQQMVELSYSCQMSNQEA